MKKRRFLTAILAVLMIVGVTVSYAHTHECTNSQGHKCTNHNHSHLEICNETLSEEESEISIKSSMACSYCNVGTIFTDRTEPTCVGEGDIESWCDYCDFRDLTVLSPLGHDLIPARFCYERDSCTRCSYEGSPGIGHLPIKVTDDQGNTLYEYCGWCGITLK